MIGIDPVAFPSKTSAVDRSLAPSFLFCSGDKLFLTNKQFKTFKSLEAYNQIVSGFLTSVQGAEIVNKIVVVAKDRHSQRMNDPLEGTWIIAEKYTNIRQEEGTNIVCET